MSKQIPVEVVTNPIWLWLFRHGVEDPSWGRRPIEQHAIAMAIHELAAAIADEKTRSQIQASAARLVADTAQTVLKESQDEVTRRAQD